MASWNVELSSKDRKNTGRLDLRYRWEEDETPEDICVHLEIRTWLKNVLEPWEFRNLASTLKAEVDSWPPEDKE